MSRSRSIVAVLLAVSVAACGGSGSPVQPTEPVAAPAPPARVVILSVDGLRPDAITAALAPNMVALAQRGAYSWTAQTIQPSETLPSHSSMLSGAPPEVHGMTWDDNGPAGALIPVPTIFGIARAAGKRTAMVASKSKFVHFNVPGTLDSFQITGRGDAAVADEAVARVRDGYDLLFVHFADVDLTGHSAGWMTSAYLAAVTEADRAVGRVIAAAGTDVTVILTADHGGSGRNHGAVSTQNRTIPWVIAGPGILPHAVARNVRTMDTAATALRVLGLDLPAGTTGVVVSEVFAAPAGSSAQLADQKLELGEDVALASGDHAAKAGHRLLQRGVVERLARVR